MSNILQEIVKCEEEALRLEEEAKKEARDILAKARKNAEQILERALLEGEAIAEEILKKAKAQADEEIKQRENTHNEADEHIRRSSAEKLEKAAQYIVGRVVNNPWQL